MTTGKAFTLKFLALLLVFVTFVFPFLNLIARVSNHFTDFSFLNLILAPMAIHLFLQTIVLAASTLLFILCISLFLGTILQQVLKVGSHSFKITQLLISGFWVLPSLFFVLLTWKLLRIAGLSDWLYSFKAVQVGWMIGFVPYVTLGVLRVLSDLDGREIEAAKTLGASSLQLFISIFLPRISPAVLSLSLQVFWLMLTSFSLVVVLGGGTPHDTLETAIYQSVRTFDIRFDRAFALAFWQALLMAVLYFVRLRYFKKVNVGLEWTKPAFSSRPQKWINQFLILAVVIVSAAFFLYTSFRTAESAVLFSPWLQSVLLAVSVSFFTLFAAAILYVSFPMIAECGAIISPMILSLMWWEAYADHFSPWVLCIGVQVALFLPWVSRSLFPLLDRKRVFELEASETLGANKLQAWLTVEWPRLKSEIKMMLAWIMAFSMGEVSSVILFSKGEFEPLSVWAQNQMSRFRFEEGFAGIKLVVFSTLFVILIAWMPSSGPGAKQYEQ